VAVCGGVHRRPNHDVILMRMTHSNSTAHTSSYYYYSTLYSTLERGTGVTHLIRILRHRLPCTRLQPVHPPLTSAACVNSPPYGADVAPLSLGSSTRLATCQPLPRNLPSIVLLQKPSVAVCTTSSSFFLCCDSFSILLLWQLLASFDACRTRPLTPLIRRFESSFYTSTRYRFFDARCCRPPHSNSTVQAGVTHLVRILGHRRRLSRSDSTAACINSLHQSAPGKQTHLSHSPPRCICLAFFSPFLAYYGACLVYQSAPLALATKVNSPVCSRETNPALAFPTEVHSLVCSRETNPPLSFATEVHLLVCSRETKGSLIRHRGAFTLSSIHLDQHSPCRAFIRLDEYLP
jgi:hypothetical protein